jgi:phage-related minor tail protein
MADPKLQVQIGAVITDLERNLAKATKSLQKFSNKSKALGKQFASTGKTMSMSLSLPLAILGGLAVKTAADFETLGVSLNTTFKGNEKAAKAAFQQIIEFASKTPFQVEQVASAFIKLKNMGLDPSEKALRSYGDTASAMGKSLDQMVEAVADAATGEFERLKEFGIKARSEGDNVSFTFRGITTTVQKEAAAIEGYLIGLGETEFTGGMEAQSKTFTGQLSTLKDNVALLSNEFGKILIEMINPLIGKIGALAKKFQELSPATKKVIVVIGLLVAALGPLLVGLGFLMTSVIPGLVVAFGYLSGTVLPAVTSAFATLNTTMLANPAVAIAAAIALLVVGFVNLLQKISPVVSKLKTFFNLVKAGFDQSKFIALQMKDVADAMEQETIEANRAAREVRILAMNQKLAADEAAKLASNLLKVAGAADVVASRSKEAGVQGTQKGAEPIPVNKQKFVAGVDENGVLTKLKPLGVEVKKELDGMIGAIDKFNEQASQLITGSIADTFGMLGKSIGEALAGGGNVLKAVGQTIIAGLGQFLSEMGGLLIKYGTLAVLKGKLDLAILAGGPLAIGAGIAAIAVGVALKAAGGALGKAANGGSGGGSTRDFSGGTAGSGRSSSSGGTINNSNGGGFGGSGTVVFEIAGTKLVGVLTNTLNRNKALGGANNLLLT